ncbi:MAG: hypothetical protein LBU27_02370 [Candidatus Peribacteria bacterium]|jgi:hypothetical protein|nr:hypothetical protein [Candidatus Peribacteria bacterium]
MKKKLMYLVVVLITINLSAFAQEQIIYLQKEYVSEVEFNELRRKNAVIDKITVYTDASLAEKISALTMDWSRDGMNDLLEDFKISPNQFGVLLDTLSSVIIKQSNDIPNTKVGKIALVGFAWKLAGPTIVRWIIKTCIWIFLLWFFIWSYKKSTLPRVVANKKEKGIMFWTIKEKEHIYPKNYFCSVLRDVDCTEIDLSRIFHIVGFVLFFFMSLFL